MVKDIFISLPSLWAIRNFIYSGVIENLKKDFNIVIMVPVGSGYADLAKETGCEVLEYPLAKYKFSERILLRALNIKLLRRSEALRKSQLVLLSMNTGESLSGKLLKYASSIFSIFIPENLLFSWYCKTLKESSFNDILSRIKKSSSKAVIATNLVVKHELMLFMHLKDMPSMKIDYINSFDNTTSRGYLPFRIFDQHIVWNQKMKDELVDIFKIKRDKVHLQGTAQFDLLTEGGKLALRADDKVYDTVENKKYILYCGGHVYLFPFEVDIVHYMITELNKWDDSLNYIIRVHPLDDQSRWSEKNFPSNVAFDTPWKQNKDNPLLSVPEKYEYLRHGRIMKNSQLVLNIGSTTSLDACVLNKPVLNIAFENYNDNKQLDLIYDSEHYVPIVKSGAAPLVYSVEELQDHILLVINNNEDPEQSRKRIAFAAEYCGFHNEQSFFIRFRNYLLNLQ